MKKMLLMLGLVSGAVFAQDQPPPDQGAPPADQSAQPPADQGQQPPADQNAQQPPADQGQQPPADQNAQQPPADQGQQPPADQNAQQPPAEGQPAEQAAAGGESKPLNLYVAVDYVSGDLSVSKLGSFAPKNYEIGMYQLRLGWRALENIGLEAHFGFNKSGGDAKVDHSYGIFAVPTATLFETVELGFPIGYNKSSVSTVGASGSLGSIAYGADLQLPLKVFSDSMPNIRFTGGGMVYYQKTDARLYGWNAGLRYDFTPGAMNFHLPHWLWPFGS